MPVRIRFPSVFRFLNREDGPTAVEYAVMLALVIVGVISAVNFVGGNANKSFTAAAAAGGGGGSASQPTFSGGSTVGVGTYTTSNYNGTGQTATFYQNNSGGTSGYLEIGGSGGNFNSSTIPGNSGTTWTQTSTTGKSG